MNMLDQMKYYLSIIAIFKNEKPILEEWIEHYLSEGVDHFYLIDNDSTDNYQIITDRYVKNNLVEINLDSRPHMQEAHYNTYYLEKVKKESDWVMIVDLDEFIYGRKQAKTIKDYLKTLADNVAQVYVPWKLFGSNGHLIQPNNCVDAFTMRTKYDHVKTNGMCDSEKILTKTIVRTHSLTKITIHYSVVNKKDKVEIISNGQLVNSSQFQPITEEILQQSMLHCNHYPIQSFEWFRQIKMSRGSASSVKNDKVRTIDYYNSFDAHSNQIVDDELFIKRNKLKIYYGLGPDHYLDVTHIVHQHFMNASGDRIIIDDDIIFNHYFTDPSPFMVKYLIIRQNHKLVIYPENKHGQIIINLSK